LPFLPAQLADKLNRHRNAVAVPAQFGELARIPLLQFSPRHVRKLLRTYLRKSTQSKTAPLERFLWISTAF